VLRFRSNEYFIRLSFLLQLPPFLTAESRSIQFLCRPSQAAAATLWQSIMVPFSGRPFPKRGMISMTANFVTAF